MFENCGIFPYLCNPFICQICSVLGEMLAALLCVCTLKALSYPLFPSWWDWRASLGRGWESAYWHQGLSFPLICCLEVGGEGKLRARLIYILASSGVLEAGEESEETQHWISETESIRGLAAGFGRWGNQGCCSVGSGGDLGKAGTYLQLRQVWHFV